MEIRLFKKDEAPMYMEAIDQIWKKGHILSRDRALLDFMFYNNPMHEKYIGKDNYGAIGVWEDGKIIGLGGLMLYEFNVNGKTELASNVTNIIVLEEYRKSMAGLLIFGKPFELYPIFCSFGIALSKLAMRISPPTITQDYVMQPIHKLMRMIGIFNKKKTAEVLLNGNEYYLRNYNIVQKVSQFGEKIVNRDLDENKWNTFYYTHIAPKTISVSRNYEFLNWRYLNHPTFEYLVYTVQDQLGNYEGLFVARVERIVNDTAKNLRIVEFISKNQDASIALANKIVEIGTEEDVLFADFYCTTDMFNFGLESVGFKKEFTSEDDQFVLPSRFLPIDLSVVNLNAVISFYGKSVRKLNLLENNIYFTKGDSDQDRPN
ncbi:GNAT family N-acetyltransferase [Brevibacillus ruminantium]|uniref:GNAT family N-acetyltransferase n=1 Tax=Brevibacillus ruminantium TaxID=2950604 RepID=A0ABY4WHW6_9BACL|nr:GNAT family N-acetyltransferase [Brevibacillus ruminantium]USG65738.1 GNAT family N-acetyltransferase [Brevibacillus ruminantium]